MTSPFVAEVAETSRRQATFPELSASSATLLLLIWLSTMFTAGRAISAEPAANLPAADEVLSDTPWYDAESNSLVPVTVETQSDDSIHRDSRWLPKAERLAKTPAPAAGGGGSSFTSQLFGWLILVAIVLVTVGVLVYAFSKTEIDLGSGTAKSAAALAGAPDEQTIERMKHLPAELRRTDVNLRSEAERLMSEAQYDQAIILLFAHQLLLLDRAGLLRLTRGKTNGRYVRETRSNDPAIADDLRQVVDAFERSYFGRHEIQGPEFVELWQRNQNIEHSIHAREGVAA